MSDIDRLLYGVVKGKKSNIKKHIQRGERIENIIYAKYKIKATKWRVKHLKWFLMSQTNQLSSATRYDYFLTIKLLAHRLHKWQDWQKHLKGPWETPSEKNQNDLQ